MISLEIDGLPLKLGENTEIDIEINCDLFNTDQTDSSIVSFPFSIPDDAEKRNARALKFFDKLETEDVPVKDIEKTALKIKGNTLYEGVFEVEKHHQGFEGVFKSGTGLLAEKGSLKIADMVGRVEFKVDFATQTNKSSEVVWPSIYCKNIDKNYDVEINRYVNGKYEGHNISGLQHSHFIPMFKLYYVMQEVFRGIDYQIGGDYMKLTGMNDIVLFNNFLTDTLGVDSILPEFRQPARFYTPNHLPDITFSDLVRSFKNTFCLALIVHSDSKSCQFWSIKNILNSPDYIDWTSKLVKDTQIGPRENMGCKTSFNWDSKDEVLSDYPKNLDAYIKGDSVNHSSDLPAPTSASKDHYRFVLKENVYYVCLENARGDAFAERTFRWEKLGAAIYPYVLGEGEKEIESDFTPIVKGIEIEGEKQLGNIRNNGGKVRITRVDWLINSPGVGSKIRIDDPEIYGAEFHTITARTVPWIIDLDLDYIEDADNIKLSYKLINNYALPVIDIPGTRLKSGLIMGIPNYSGHGTYANLISIAHPGQTNTNFAARIMIYHGLQQKKNSSELYPYASPDNYDSKGNRIGELALRWDGPDGLIENFWKETLEFLNTTRIVTHKLQLTIEDLINFQPQRKVMINGQRFLVKKISVPLRMDGIGLAEVEMRKV